MMPSLTLLAGDCRTVLKSLPDASVDCAITSPPYFGLRMYSGGDKEIGLEKSPEEYVANLVDVFREVRRVLKDTATLWLVLGDSYSGSWGNYGGKNRGAGKQRIIRNGSQVQNRQGKFGPGLKPKDLIGIPWLVAFALRADGWFLRSEITWLKRVPMPESVKDRPTSATEKIFLLSKASKYYYDAAAVRQPPSESFAKGHERRRGSDPFLDDTTRSHQMANGSNMRNYWLLSPENFKGEHFAVFPTEIPRRCILAGTKRGDVVLDPFAGTFTTGMVALELARSCIGIELNPDYLELARQRTDVTPGLPL